MDNPLLKLHSLFVLANPVDRPRFDDDYVWQKTCEVLQPFQARGALTLKRLQPANGDALLRCLAMNSCHVLHLMVHGNERPAARYGTIALESSDHRAANVTAQALGAMVASASLALVILQSVDGGPPCFEIVSEELIARGVPAVLVAPRLGERAQKTLLSKVYSGLLLGGNADQLASDLAAARSTENAALDLVRILSRDPLRPLLVSPVPSTTVEPVDTNAADFGWKEILSRKRAADAFDVFLCHNREDKPAVQRIAQKLKAAGILPWLDVEELPPGRPWQPLLEKQINSIQSAAVCVGAAGIGPWQEREMYGFLIAFVQRGVPVIPLLLPDAPLAPDLPVFLSQMTWVDFRTEDSKPLLRLIWGITGKRPDL